MLSRSSARQVSSQDEELLVEAIAQAAALVDEDNLHPTAALHKVAVDMSLTEAQIRLIGQGLNTGMTLNHRKKAASLEERVGSHPLANIQKVIDKRFPKQAVKEAADTIDSQYSRRPSWVNLPEKQETIKQAEFAPPPPPRPRSIPRQRMLNILKIAESNRREVELRAVAAGFAHRDAIAEMRKWAKGTPVEKIAAAALVAGLTHGSDGVEAVVKSAEAVGITIPDTLASDYRVKAAAASQPAEVRAAVKLAGIMIQAVSKLQTELDEFKKVAEKAEELIQIAEYHLTGQPELKPDANRSLVSAAKGEKRASFTTQVRDLSSKAEGRAGKSLLKRLDMEDQDKTDRKTLGKLTDPFHEDAIRQIRAQAALHGITNSPALAGENPENIATAFNEISSLAPRAAENSAMLGAMIRRRLSQGQLDPYDIDQLLGTELKVKQLREPRKEQHLPKTPEVDPASRSGPQTDED